MVKPTIDEVAAEHNETIAVVYGVDPDSLAEAVAEIEGGRDADPPRKRSRALLADIAAEYGIDREILEQTVTPSTLKDEYTNHGSSVFLPGKALRRIKRLRKKEK